MSRRPKAPKTKLSRTTFDLTRAIRRNLDSYDRSPDATSVRLLNEALVESRKLVKFLQNTVDQSLAAYGGSERPFPVALDQQ